MVASADPAEVGPTVMGPGITPTSSSTSLTTTRSSPAPVLWGSARPNLAHDALGERELNNLNKSVAAQEPPRGALGSGDHRAGGAPGDLTEATTMNVRTSQDDGRTALDACEPSQVLLPSSTPRDLIITHNTISRFCTPAPPDPTQRSRCTGKTSAPSMWR